MEEMKEQVISLPRLGEPAPAFEAATTQGLLKLEDFFELCRKRVNRPVVSSNLLSPCFSVPIHRVPEVSLRIHSMRSWLRLCGSRAS